MEKNDDENEEEKIPEWRVNVSIPRKPFAGGYFKVRIENESGKININYADESLLKIMLDSFELDDMEKRDIVDSILDWRDADNLHRLNGAEDDYYRSLPDPYDCKDGPFDSIEELLLVKGVTSELFYEKGLQNLLTAVYYKELEKLEKPISSSKAIDFTKVDINAAPPEILRAFPQMDMTIIDEIRLFREEKDFKNLNELATVVGSSAFQAISPYITMDDSDYFTIESLGMVEGSSIRHTIKALIQIDFENEKKYRIIRWYDAVETSRDLEYDLADEISDSGV
jgi:general secretion pathway protein K